MQMPMRNGLMALLAANKGRGFFRADVGTNGEATLYLYDAIVSDDFWGGVSAISVMKELANLRDASTIHLRINSPGGDVFAGRAIEQGIREHPANIISHVDGYAASAMSYVAIAANEVVMAPGAMFMIHKAWTVGWGNSEDLLKTAALLEHIDESLVETYATATGQDPAQLRDWMRAETWFTAADSVANGFADRIAGQEDGASAKARTGWDLSAYAHAPSSPAPAIQPENQDIPQQPAFDPAHALRRLEAALI